MCFTVCDSSLRFLLLTHNYVTMYFCCRITEKKYNEEYNKLLSPGSNFMLYLLKKRYQQIFNKLLFLCQNPQTNIFPLHMLVTKLMHTAIL